MKFKVTDSRHISSSENNVAYLLTDKWNDFSFVTMFHLFVFDENKERHDLGSVKIGFKGQCSSDITHENLDKTFDTLPENYFSLGMDVDYYRNICNFSETIKQELLSGLKDIVYSPKIIDNIMNEEVFNSSFLRHTSISLIKGQFSRVLNGGALLTNFEFKFKVPESDNQAFIDLDFKVIAESFPSTNIHAIIGRNGVGKTNLLNKMTEAITSREEVPHKFLDTSELLDISNELISNRPISSDYFSSLVSVSFSVFDSFLPPPEKKRKPTKGVRYYYIGIRDFSSGDNTHLKELPQLYDDLSESISTCLSEESKKRRWLDAINKLESDENFSEMNIKSLCSYKDEELKRKILKLAKKMSSGHAVVFITISKLVATVEEKTLVLIDEPESHLHPPLLSAFVRALSQLLYNRNGVAIIATHSPVVLQEIPTSCVWKIFRSGLSMDCSRPEIETFGENVGILTREVFGLEVVKSGFHQLLKEFVDNGLSYEEIIDKYGNNLGYEAKAILKAMTIERERDGDDEQ